MKLSVIGLGKLGAPMAAVMAAKGHNVIGLDLNEDFVAAVNQGKAPVEEPQLQEFIDRSDAQLSATTDYAAAIAGSDVTFLIVPTPSTQSGSFSLDFVLDSIAEIGAALKHKNSPHLIIVTSTVMPGAMDREVVPALERASGRTVGVDVGLCYSPEFIALGSVIQDMLTPDFVLIGESDSGAGDTLSEIYRSVCDIDPVIRRMNFVNAELTKISVNTFVTMKISYANTLAELCDGLPGADADTVSKAVGSDSRIGVKYLKGALGYGGPCFPRDNRAFAYLANTLNALPALATATDEVNHHQNERLVRIVRDYLSPGQTVAVLGLSYKPDTAVIEESVSISLSQHLANEGYQVTVYDPMAMPPAKAVLRDTVLYADSAENAIFASDMVIIATAWAEFARIPPATFKRASTPRIILDCWRILTGREYGESAHMVYLGIGNDENVQAPEHEAAPGS